MIEVQPSLSVERAKQMLRDPDGYFVEARKRAEQQVKAERAARKATPARAGRGRFTGKR